jgi:hypothetical protein
MLCEEKPLYRIVHLFVSFPFLLHALSRRRLRPSAWDRVLSVHRTKQHFLDMSSLCGEKKGKISDDSNNNGY